ncbi:hypothetical protein [Streptomyces sp. MJM1172]|uniref:hypothetical protein n=1 Tax=Streptomyces sp. MJM1172 TaxID=1703926 RepID=UPI0009403A66|nr:hypothetical protein [Streptomyces sp. MJM1172]OKI50314.1 hypothetical protein AMK15_32665 [Streptomyces sp. MJM1172]
MRHTPQTTAAAAASLEATKALLGLQRRGYLHRAERRDFGWLAVIKQGEPPVVMYSPEGVMTFVRNHTQPHGLAPVRS